MSENRPIPDRPLSSPRAVHRPPVDPATERAFSSDNEVASAAFRLQPAAKSASAATNPEDPILAEAFRPEPGERHSIGRPRQRARALRYRNDVSPDDPWRRPESPVGIGPAALASSTPSHQNPIDITRNRELLTVRDVLFGGRASFRALAVVAAVAVLIGAIAGIAGSVMAQSFPELTSDRVRLAQAPIRSEEISNPVGKIAAAVQPAVVNIQVSSGSVSGEGSGVVVDGKGYIVTNNHVVSPFAEDPDNGSLDVVFSDGTTVPAEIVGRDTKTDLAVVKVSVDNLTVAVLGNSDEVEVGQSVLAIGSPLGLSKTVTTGIVSAINRPLSLSGEGSDTAAVIDAVQTDASINPGNSGGPLVDDRGAVIGINTSIFTQSGGSIGLGFAIPVNEVKSVSQALITAGSVRHPQIGVNARTASNGSIDGAEIVNVRTGSPAAEADLREGDVVTKVGERSVHSADELVIAVRSAGADRDAPISIIRDGRPIELTIKPVLN